MKRLLLATAAIALAAPSQAQDAAEPPTPGSIVAEAPAADWRAIDPADLLVMTLAPDRDRPSTGSGPRQVTIQLMPAPFSQGWVGNVRTLAKAHWWDGTSVYRVVDNWVAQWGDGEDDTAKAKPLPEGLRVVPESEYSISFDLALRAISAHPETPRPAEVGEISATAEAIPPAEDLPEEVPTEAEIPPDANAYQDIAFVWESPDQYAQAVAFFDGIPYAYSGEGEGTRYWPVHCYASVGVARDLSPDTGTGAELYAVIGHAPRALDRNIAVVGRVIEGIEHLSTLPRGKGEAGVYDDPALRVPILSVRLGNELPQAEQPRFEYLASDSESFARYVEVRANRNDAFYKVPAGGVDVCNVQVPIRRVAG